jgi:hypothetical protein
LQKEIIPKWINDIDAASFMLESLAKSYASLGMHTESDYYLSRITARQSDEFEQFLDRAFALKDAGKFSELRSLVETTLSDPSLDLSQRPEYEMVDIGTLQVVLGNYAAGIEFMEIPFDVMSLEIVDYNDPQVAIGIMQTLAFAYERNGQTADAEQLLHALQGLLDELLESGLGMPKLFATNALNLALIGDAEGARQFFERAVAVGFRDYFEITGDPVWADTLQLPGFAELLDEMKQDIDRQRILVEQADAEDNFRAVVEQLFPQ